MVGRGVGVGATFKPIVNGTSHVTHRDLERHVTAANITGAAKRIVAWTRFTDT